MATLALKVLWDLLEQLVILALMDQLGSQEHEVKGVMMVRRDIPVKMETKDIKVNPATLEPLVHREMLALRDQLEYKDLPDQRAQVAKLVFQVYPVKMGLKDTRDQLACQDQLAREELMV